MLLPSIFTLYTFSAVFFLFGSLFPLSLSLQESRHHRGPASYSLYVISPSIPISFSITLSFSLHIVRDLDLSLSIAYQQSNE